MNGLNNITEKILSDACERADIIIKEAQQQASEIIADAEKTAENNRAEMLKKAENDAKAIKTRASSQANMMLRGASLSARRKCLDNAFSGAVNKLCELDDTAYIEFAASLIADLRTEDAELILNAEDAKRVGDAMIKRAVELSPEKSASLVLSKDHGNFRGGFILKEGDIYSNCTFETLVQSSRDKLEPEAASIIFG